MQGNHHVLCNNLKKYLGMQNTHSFPVRSTNRFSILSRDLLIENRVNFRLELRSRHKAHSFQSVPYNIIFIMLSMGDSMWYILQVDTGSEEYVKDKLEQLMPQGLLNDVFYPMCEYYYKKSGSRNLRTGILFPGYLFLDVNEKRVEELKNSLKRLTQRQRLLTTGKDCSPVGVEERNFFLKHMNRYHVLTMSRGNMRGREVRITEGAFAGYCGELKYVDRHNRYGVMTIKLGEQDVDMRFGLEIMEKA